MTHGFNMGAPRVFAEYSIGKCYAIVPIIID